MYKKEIKDAAIQSLGFAGILLVLSFIIPLAGGGSGPFMATFFPLLQGGMLVFAIFIGMSIFESERKQNGMEYLMSLPYSRFKLLGIKVLPRLAAVLVFLFVYLLLYRDFGASYSAFGSFSFPVLYMAFFLLALSFSAGSKNFLATAVTVFVSVLAYLGVSYLVFSLVISMKAESLVFPFFMMFTADTKDLYQPFISVLGAMMPLVPFILAFVLAFKRFDAKSSKSFNKGFLKYSMMMLIPALVLSFVFAYNGLAPEYKNYFLTKNRQLIAFSWFSNSLEIYDENDKKEIECEFSPYIYFEKEGFLYGFGRTYKTGSWTSHVFRLNPGTAELDILYKTKMLTWYNLHHYGNTLAFFEYPRKKKDEKTLVFLDIPTKKVKRVDVNPFALHDVRGWRVFGAGGTGEERFWLVGMITKGKPWWLLRVSEDGSVKKFGESKTSPSFINEMVISNDGRALMLSRIVRDGEDYKLETVKSFPEGKKLGFHHTSFRSKLDNTRLKEMYNGRLLNENKWKLYHLDLDNLALNPLAYELKDGHIRYLHPDRFYFFGNKHVDNKGGLLERVYRLKNGEIVLVREFDAPVEMNDYYYYRIHDSGVVISNKGEVKVYAFPDLEELKFNSL